MLLARLQYFYNCELQILNKLISLLIDHIPFKYQYNFWEWTTIFYFMTPTILNKNWISRHILKKTCHVTVFDKRLESLIPWIVDTWYFLRSGKAFHKMSSSNDLSLVLKMYLSCSVFEEGRWVLVPAASGDRDVGIILVPFCQRSGGSIKGRFNGELMS